MSQQRSSQNTAGVSGGRVHRDRNQETAHLKKTRPESAGSKRRKPAKPAAVQMPIGEPTADQIEQLRNRVEKFNASMKLIKAHVQNMSKIKAKKRFARR